MTRYCIGSRIRAGQIRLGVVAESGQAIEIWTIPTLKRMGCKAILANMSDEIDRKLESLGIAHKDVMGIGISVPGEVSDNGVLNYCKELGWGIVNINELSEKLCGMKVRTGSCHDMAVLGEQWVLGEDAPENMVVFLIENELRGGIVIHNRLVRGRDGRRSDIGEMLVHQRSGENGSLAWEKLYEISSLKNMVEAYRNQARRYGTLAAEHDMNIVTIKEIQKAAHNGDPLSSKILDGAADAIAIAIHNVNCVVTLGKVVIGGEYKTESLSLAERISGKYAKYEKAGGRVLEISPSELGEDAEVYGSARFFIL